MIELQDIIDKQNKEQTQMKERLTALSSRVTELEEDLDTARKDLIKSEEMNTKLQRDVREVRKELSGFGESQMPLVYKILVSLVVSWTFLFLEIFARWEKNAFLGYDLASIFCLKDQSLKKTHLLDKSMTN